LLVQVLLVPFDIGIAAAVVLLGSWGALQCFWPSKLRRLRDKLGRGYKAESPLGRLMERSRSTESGLLTRLSGLFLILVSILLFVWWFSSIALFRGNDVGPFSAPLCLRGEIHLESFAL
jgi:hypothetical protein